MKKTKWIIPALIMIVAAACQKANDISSQVSLTASTTQAVVGQTVWCSVGGGRVCCGVDVSEGCERFVGGVTGFGLCAGLLGDEAADR